MPFRRLPPSTPTGTLLTNLFALATTLSLGVAMGVVWLMATLLMQHGTSWLALPAGAVLGWTLRWSLRATPTWHGLLAGLATVVAELCVGTGFVALQVAGNMGMGPIETLRAAGPAMLWQLLRMGTSPLDTLWYALGVALAAWIASRRPRAG